MIVRVAAVVVVVVLSVVVVVVGIWKRFTLFLEENVNVNALLAGGAGSGDYPLHLGRERGHESHQPGDRVAQPPQPRGDHRRHKRAHRGHLRHVEGRHLHIMLMCMYVYVCTACFLVTIQRSNIIILVQEKIVQPLLVNTSEITLATECVGKT